MKISQSRIHFIGIGGSGMNGLAELVHNIGAKVTGSDLSENSQVERLRSMGMQIFKGHDAKNIGDVDVVVYSSAVPVSNPEIVEAKRRAIPIIPRIEVLVEIMRLKRGIAVGGTHGKTTTTSMCAAILLEANIDPTVVIGGRLDLIKSHALLGKGEWLVAESDESDGSFLKLSPEIAIITNIDNDHLDYYKTFEQLQFAFLEFARKVPFYGFVVACGDQQIVRQTLASFNKRILFYGESEQNDYRIEKIVSGPSLAIATPGYGYRIYKKQTLLGEVSLKVPGHHNALNALAAIVVACEIGVSFDKIKNGIERFQGVDRRLQFRGEAGGVTVVDDYGHHPTEVKATLQALRERYPANKIVVAFQPHRYTRTENCWNDFLSAFSDADQVMLWDIYAAGETPLPDITSERMAKELRHQCVQHAGTGTAALEKLMSTLKPGDVLLTLGAGDISKVGPAVLERLSS